MRPVSLAGMKTSLAAVRRLFARFPLWAGVTSIAALALVLGGSYAAVQAMGTSGANSTAPPSPSSEVSPSVGASTPSFAPLPSPADTGASGAPSATSTPSLSPTVGPRPSIATSDSASFVIVKEVGPEGPSQGLISAWTQWDEAGGSVAFFTSADHGRNTLYEVNLDGTGLRSIWTRSAQIRQVAWAPDGGSVAILTYHSNYAVQGEHDLVVVELDGGVSHTVLRDRAIEQISWSADGERLWFSAAESEGFGDPTAWMIENWDASTQSVVDVRPGRYPAHAPDVDQFVSLVDHDGDGTYGTWLLDDDGNLLSLISGTESTTFFFGDERAGPAWSPDGRFMVFCVPASGNSVPGASENCTGVRVADLSTAFFLERVWGTGGYWFSPDGKAVLARGKYNYRVVNTATGRVRWVTAPGGFEQLAWSGTSNYLMYLRYSETDAGAQPCTFRVDTGRAGNCLAAPSPSGSLYGHSELPAISPSGGYILEPTHDLAENGNVDLNIGYTILWTVPDGVLPDGAFGVPGT